MTPEMPDDETERLEREKDLSEECCNLLEAAGSILDSASWFLAELPEKEFGADWDTLSLLISQLSEFTAKMQKGQPK